MHTRYLIVGGSHAGLEALRAIRAHDQDASLVLVSREKTLPYSPTVLPYVISGRSDPARIFLRDEAYFFNHKVDYLRGASLTRVIPESNLAEFASGEQIYFEKLLLATGARPTVSPIPGLRDVPYHVLRTLDHALRLRGAAGDAGRALVMGAGLIGMHAAENLRKAGMRVTVVETRSQVLPGYFDAKAAGVIESVFTNHGVEIMTNRSVESFTPRGSGGVATLDAEQELPWDLLLVAAGVAPEMDYLKDSAIETDRGILVDETMQTSNPNIWAAGDVAQARDFFSDQRLLNGILPDAVEQGRIAGMAMAEDPALRPYSGGVPINTYTFFGQQAISVGTGAVSENEPGVQIQERHDSLKNRYLRIVTRNDRLMGIFGINTPFDGGIMWELILRGIDLAPVKEKLCIMPLEAGRVLMSRNWR